MMQTSATEALPHDTEEEEALDDEEEEDESGDSGVDDNDGGSTVEPSPKRRRCLKKTDSGDKKFGAHTRTVMGKYGLKRDELLKTFATMDPKYGNPVRLRHLDDDALFGLLWYFFKNYFLSLSFLSKKNLWYLSDPDMKANLRKDLMCKTKREFRQLMKQMMEIRLENG